jgi:hypothetical protein
LRYSTDGLRYSGSKRYRSACEVAAFRREDVLPLQRGFAALFLLSQKPLRQSLCQAAFLTQNHLII